ncbi:MAG: glycine betaine ABC transporter substrate-binding protein [Solirubrobacteraceae bacterium]
MKPRLILAALAALAVALSACGSSDDKSSSSSSSTKAAAPSGQPGKGKPPVTLGDKNFTEQYILGELYAQALRAKGFTVKVKSNIGSSEITDKALTSGKIDLYPEYTGVIVTELSGAKDQPKSAADTYTQAKTYEEGRGYALLKPTPFFDADGLAVKPAFAKKNGLADVGDLKKLSSFTYGAPPENKTRYQGVVGMKKAYGLDNFSFKPLSIGLQYKALESDKIDVAAVFTTDAQLAGGKYTVLKDSKGIFGFQNVAPVVSKKVLTAQGPAFEQTLDAVSAKLTNEAMQKMNGAVDLDKQKPAAVAKSFLQANGLLSGS